MTTYRPHWQDHNGQLVKRWDNAPHYRAIETFPHHLHDGSENHVVSHPAITGLEVLQQILAEVEGRDQARGSYLPVVSFGECHHEVVTKRCCGSSYTPALVVQHIAVRPPFTPSRMNNRVSVVLCPCTPLSSWRLSHPAIPSLPSCIMQNNAGLPLGRHLQ